MSSAVTEGIVTDAAADNVPQDASVPTAKLDPETLEIRARPRRAIRFRRGVIIGVAASGSASLLIVAWMALKPQIHRQVVQESGLSEQNANAANDRKSALSGKSGFRNYKTRWSW